MLILNAADTLEAIASAAAVVTVTVAGMTHTSSTDTYLKVYQGQVGNSATTLYTVAASTQLLVKSIIVVNTDVVARTIKLWQAGHADTNIILPAVSLAASEYAVYASDGWKFYTGAGLIKSGVGAPNTSDYLVGTADAGLTSEIVVGTTPGGELGGTWASPTVDTTHSGSAHHAEQHAMDSGSEHTSSDVATLDASTAQHGFLKKLDNVATHYMDGTGAWSVPPGGGDVATVLTTSTTSADVAATGIVLVTRTIGAGTIAAGTTYVLEAIGDIALDTSRTGTFRLRYNGTTLVDATVTAAILTATIVRDWHLRAIITFESTTAARCGVAWYVELAGITVSGPIDGDINHAQAVAVTTSGAAALDLFYFPDSNTGTNSIDCFQAAISKMA